MGQDNTSHIKKVLSQNDAVVTQFDDSILVNRLTGDAFTLRDIVKDENFEVNFYHQDLTPELQFWIKECFVCFCGGWNNPELQTLSARVETARHWKNALLRIGVWASIKYPMLPLARWTEPHVKELLLDVLDNNINWTGDTEKSPLGRGPIEAVVRALSQSRQFKLKGMLSDGIGFDFPKNFIESCLESKLNSYQTSYHDWFNSGGYESIPLPVAMGLLHDAISILRDEKTLFLKDYFKYQRTSQFYGVYGIMKGNFDKFCNGEWKTKKGDIVERAEGLKKIIDQHFYGEIIGFPFSNCGSLSDHCRDVYDACIVIFLCLTGIRISELESICADDYDQEIDGTWVFDSELIKTNMGIMETREMHGLVAEAAEVLVDLSYIDKRNRIDGERLPLFGRYFYSTDFQKNANFRRNSRTIKKSALSNRLNLVFSKFLQRHPEFEPICSTIHAHRFRHTWAEFALRRFEGNVFEAIRRHFRHSYGSYFTTNYVFDKLTDEVRDQIEKQYLKEILTKLATENVQAFMDDGFKRDLHGKIAYYISKSMDATVITETEIDDFVNEMAEEFEGIVAHEYGYCLVRKNLKHLAKCVDKETQTPRLDTGVFESCSDCIHFIASESSNKDSITRIAVSHQYMIARFTDLMGDNVKSKAIDTSKNVLKRAEAMLDEMEASS